MNTISDQPLDCTYSGICGGCPWSQKTLHAHLTEKASAIVQIFPQAKFRFTPRDRVRDKVDLVWSKAASGEMHLGLYALNSREVLDLAQCPMMSEALEAWFMEFRQRAPAIVRGSVRLRVSPSGERGVWLDFANNDVKDLFADREYLKWLSARAFVEIGQRRKALVWRDGEPKLVDPILKPWFETYDANMQPIPLYGPVGGFSQVGFAANRHIVKAVCELAAQSGVQDWLELFCGNGNFALALAARGYQVEAVELDELALRGLEQTLQQTVQTISPAPSLKIQRTDVYLKTQNLSPLGERGLLVDPPRAGLRELFKSIEQAWAPQFLIYVSCYSDVFVKDCARLAELGYQPRAVTGIDQYPFSPNAEWVALFERTEFDRSPATS